MMSNTFKRFLCAAMAFVMLFVLMPVGAITAEAAENKTIVDAAVIFTDLHTNKSNYKESNLKGVLNAVKNAGLPVSSVTSGGDAFSVNEDSSSSNGPYTGLTSTLTGYIQSIFNVPVTYVWSDHDRYAVLADGSTKLDKTSHLAYGDGNDGIYGTDDDANYYVYALSMGDLSSFDRYNAGFSSNRSNNGFTSSIEQAIANFNADAAMLKKDRPLLIVSHQPLFNRRNDNAFAEQWFDAINEVAKDMDVFFFFGHNHKYDESADYYYEKSSQMPVATKDKWTSYAVGKSSSGVTLSSRTKTLNFTHMCAGYLEPTSTGSYSSSGTRRGTAIAVTIYDDSVQLTTYNSSGVYTGNFAKDVSVPRDHAAPTHTHDFNTVTSTVAATCTEDGSVTKSCACGEVQTETISATGHNYNHVTTDATCTEDGSIVSTCANCGDVVQETISATGHDYTVTTTDATCTTAGKTTYTCVNCNDTYTETSTATGHNYETHIVAPTCTEDGYTVYTCSDCGDVVQETIPATGHDYTVTTTDATCTTAGKTTYTCVNCNDTYTETSTVTGHNYEARIVAPTCTETGYTVYTCSNCGVYYNTSYVSATGHNMVDTVTDATCTTAGHTTSRCTTCGYTTTGDSVPALGHNYVASEGNGCVVYTCSRCDSTYTENIAGNFTYNKVTKFSNKEAYVITLYSGGKYYALSHKNNVLSPVQVTVSRNKITSDVTEDMVWDYNSKVLSYKDGNTTYKLYAKSASVWGTPTLQLSTSNSTSVTLSSNSLKLGSYYLRYSNNTIVLNRSSSTAYLFIQNEA